MFGFFKKSKPAADSPANPKDIRKNFHTDSGMLCLWDAKTYYHIDDYEPWEKEFLEQVDIERNIRAETFVPINIQSDGTFEVDIRLMAPPSLSDREQTYLVVASDPYRLNSHGKIVVSGIEHVGSDFMQYARIFDLPPNKYLVQINLIAWDEEPGSKDPNGSPSKSALPDFIVFIWPDDGVQKTIRQSMATFSGKKR